MSHAGDLSKVIDGAKAQGFRVEKTNGNHWRFLAPNKRDIVVTGGTPSDRRSWNNFLSQLRRAGYRPGDECDAGRSEPAATTPLGDAIAAARTSVPLTDVIRDLLRLRGETGASFDEVCEVVNARRPDVSRNGVSATLAHLRSRSEIVDVERGRYRIAVEPEPPDAFQKAMEAAAVAQPDHPQPVPSAAVGPSTVIATPIVAQVAAAVAPSKPDDDDGVDEDLRVLDRLLEAMADAEPAVRRIREFVAKRRALRAGREAIEKLLEQLEGV